MIYAIAGAFMCGAVGMFVAAVLVVRSESSRRAWLPRLLVALGIVNVGLALSLLLA